MGHIWYAFVYLTSSAWLRDLHTILQGTWGGTRDPHSHPGTPHLQQGRGWFAQAVLVWDLLVDLTNYCVLMWMCFLCFGGGKRECVG